MGFELRPYIGVLSFVLIASALFALALALGGCAAPAPIVEYRYIEAKCPDPQKTIDEVKRPIAIEWLAIDLNASRLYCTSQGATLLTNLRSCSTIKDSLTVEKKNFTSEGKR